VANPSTITNRTYIGIIDYTLHSSKRRFFIIDVRTKKITYHHTAHGTNSDDGNGNTVSFSNQDGSHKTSLGFMRTGETYFGSHGRSLRTHGLSPTNSNNLSRYIVIHKAWYVTDSHINRYGRAGRSWGCPAVDPAVYASIINRLSNEGSAVIYAYGE
jgi:hypothetical protein